MQRLLLEHFEADISHVEIHRIVAVAFPEVRRRMDKGTKTCVYDGVVLLPSCGLLSSEAAGQTSPQPESASDTWAMSVQERAPYSSSLASVSTSVPMPRSQPLRGAVASSDHLVRSAAGVNWEVVTHVLLQEMENLRASGCPSLLEGPLSKSDLDSFSLTEIQDTLRSCSPHLWDMLCALASRPNISSADWKGSEISRLGATVTSSLMMKFRDARANGMQLLTSLVLIAKGTKKEAITHLNHLGICLSYQQAWRRLQSLAAADQGSVFHQPLLWVYDNLNIYRGVRHERKGG